MFSVPTSDDERSYNDEHDVEHHRDLLVYYCLAILPVLTLSIILPGTCYSMRRRRHAEREKKLD
jgi:hypothetical protein